MKERWKKNWRYNKEEIKTSGFSNHAVKESQNTTNLINGAITACYVNTLCL